MYKVYNRACPPTQNLISWRPVKLIPFSYSLAFLFPLSVFFPSVSLLVVISLLLALARIPIFLSKAVVILGFSDSVSGLLSDFGHE